MSGYGWVRNPINTLEDDGMTEQGSSGSALVRTGPEGHVIGVLSHGPPDGSVCRGERIATAGYGGFRDFYPWTARYISDGSL